METTGREGGDAECIDQIPYFLNQGGCLKIFFELSQNQTLVVPILASKVVLRV